MREILFRGKTKSGDWVYGDLLNVGVDYDYAIRTYGGREHGQVNSVNEKTVGQYTGLTDKNGKKIFEGDIVNIEYEDTIVYRAVINYIGSSFCGDSSYDSWDLDGFVSIEVIGNVHDNPELLKGR